MTTKPKVEKASPFSRKQLFFKLRDLESSNQVLATRNRDLDSVLTKVSNEKEAQRQDVKALEKRLEDSRKDFADLKARLLTAELANAEMRGYITGLQEDDVVREELVTTGDPNGQQRMVPKRKHRTFEGPNQMTIPRDNRHEFDETMSRYASQREERKPRCWVEY